MRLGGRRFLLSFAIIGAAVCLALGISLPILKLTKFVFWSSEYSLMSTVGVLLQQGQTFLGLVVLVFSIVFPHRQAALPAPSRRCRRPSSGGTPSASRPSSGSANGRCTTCWCWR
ncbi:MAG: paraquat-inducible protein A [Xanthobacteraceae bacterium]|nr:paraquat-inducible protein A [Xanthobacteraceae bacterium]